MNNQWYLEGACRDNPQFVDFPSLKETKLIKQSKAICRSCPVRRECWADAYVSHTDEGIFGGALPSERTMMGAILNIPPRATFETVVMMLQS